MAGPPAKLALFLIACAWINGAMFGNFFPVLPPAFPALFGYGLGGETNNRNIFVIRDDLGGKVGLYANRYTAIAEMQFDVVIDGECTSACTQIMFLLPPERVCMTERARFGFHLVSLAGLPMPDSTEDLVKKYPRVVRGWIARHGPLTDKVIYMQPSDLHGYFPTCLTHGGELWR